MSRLQVAVCVIAACGIIGIGGYIQLGVWNECREFGHSWFYCLRIVSAK